MDYTLLILPLIFGVACYFLAKFKKRNPWLWFLLGFFFSFIPLLVLVVLPKGDLEDEIYQLKVKMRQLEDAKNREKFPDVKIKISK